MAAQSSSEAQYESADASLLAATPSVPRDQKPSGDNKQSAQWAQMRLYLENRLAGLRNWRLSWWQHWALLATNILPRRYHWLITPNQMVRGLPINSSIIDPTGTLAMRICSAGLMSNMTNPTRRWFRLNNGIAGKEFDGAGQKWADEVEHRMLSVMAGSNYYDSKAQQYEDLVIFGTAPKLIYEDTQDVIRCYNPCAGEYFLGAASSMRVETFYRQFVMTVAQIVEMFGIDNVGPQVAELWRGKGSSLEVEFIVAHAIEPNFSVDLQEGGKKNEKLGVVAGGFTYREYYWLWGLQTDKPLSVRGFHSQPFTAPRWATTSNDPYGRSPAMDALPDILQLQVMARRLAEAIEKQVRPPMQADKSLKNEPSSTLPGKITYVENVHQGGMRPIFTVNPQINEMKELIREIQTRVQRWFFNDMFLMISQMEGIQPRNELEIIERKGEKLQVLGPVIEKLQHEDLSADIQRIYSIMDRRGLIPEKPPSLQGIPIEVQYVSQFSQAQQAADLTGIERSLSLAGRMAGAFPGIMDNIDSDATWRTYANALNVPADTMVAEDVVAKTRQKRMQQQQAEKAMAQTAALAPVAADTAQTLAETDVGGGQSALQLMTGLSQ